MLEMLAAGDSLTASPPCCEGFNGARRHSVNTKELQTHRRTSEAWQNRQFILLSTMTMENSVSLNPPATSLSSDDSMLPQLIQPPSGSSSAVLWPVRQSLRAIQCPGDSMIKLDDADDADEAGGRTAAPNLAEMSSKDAP